MKSLILAALLVSTTSLAPALAADLSVDGSFDMDVIYSQQKLDTPEGAQAEYEHIRQQIVKRCAAEHPGKIYARHYVERICVQPLVERTVSQISHPNLKAVHDARN